MYREGSPPLSTRGTPSSSSATSNHLDTSLDFVAMHFRLGDKPGNKNVLAWTMARAYDFLWMRSEEAVQRVQVS